MNVKNEIIALFEQKIELSVNTIVSELNISNQYVHRILKQLVESNAIEKIGLPPKTIYRKKEAQIISTIPKANISKDKELFLNNILS